MQLKKKAPYKKTPNTLLLEANQKKTQARMKCENETLKKSEISQKSYNPPFTSPSHCFLVEVYKIITKESTAET